MEPEERLREKLALVLRGLFFVEAVVIMAALGGKGLGFITQNTFFIVMSFVVGWTAVAIIVSFVCRDPRSWPSSASRQIPQ
jgi:hypothetical protein